MDLDEKVKSMLALPVSSEPDSVVGYKRLVRRILTVKGCEFDNSSNSMISVRVEFIPQDETQPELYDTIFNVLYRGADNDKRSRELIDFVNSFKGQWVKG